MSDVAFFHADFNFEVRARVLLLDARQPERHADAGAQACRGGVARREC